MLSGDAGRLLVALFLLVGVVRFVVWARPWRLVFSLVRRG